MSENKFTINLPPLPAIPGIEIRQTKFLGYAVGSDGSVWSVWGRGYKGGIPVGWRILNVSIDNHGYRQVAIRGPNRKTQIKTAILVCEAFHGPRPEGMETLHYNGIRNDDRADNLRWGTRSDNMKDAIRHGTMRGCFSKGVISPRRSLRIEQAREIYSRKETKTRHTVRDTAIEFGVSRNCIQRIWKGESYPEAFTIEGTNS